jgi:ubiquinol-cytochrome c reductase cytochrome c1 subunit
MLKVATRAARPLFAGTLAVTVLLAAALSGATARAEDAPPAAAAPAAAAPVETLDWTKWRAGNDVKDLASLRRGAHTFATYCIGCHSMKYVRWSRMASDLQIPADELANTLLPAGAKAGDYIQGTLQDADAVAWFGKVPPDLSLMARARGPDRLYQFLKSFYVDPARPTRANNLVLPNPAMPPVLSTLEGVKEAVYTNVQVTSGGKTTVEKRFDHFTTTTPGELSPEQYDAFVRDTVNFLDYAGEPVQVQRRSTGVWVVLFLLLFTGVSWALYKEYWKDIH